MKTKEPRSDELAWPAKSLNPPIQPVVKTSILTAGDIASSNSTHFPKIRLSKPLSTLVHLGITARMVSWTAMARNMSVKASHRATGRLMSGRQSETENVKR